MFYCFHLFFCTGVTTSTARTLSCPCQNGGVCTIPGSQTCSCSNGFTGRFCERSLCKYNNLIFRIKKRDIRYQYHFGYHRNFSVKIK
jgi:hypothetical protein